MRDDGPADSMNFDYISLLKNLGINFKFETELASSSHTLGRTIVFGGAWTLPVPKPRPPK